MSGRVVHFEVPYDDGDRARSFYGDVFGWQIHSMPEMQYDMVSTGPVSDQGMPSEPGYVGGGMTQRGELVSRPVITIAVDDIDDTLKTGPVERRVRRRRAGPRRRHGDRRILPGQRGQPHGHLAERRLTPRVPGHAGRRSPRRRSSAGRMPRESANARYSRASRARSRSGRAVRTARSRTFLEVCSSATNSTTWTS